MRAPVPPHPEYDLLWFIAHYAPELEQWERDIFLMVRAESFYFYPVFACQIMNEGWASYWHARLLREADFLPQPLYLVGDQGAFRRGAARSPAAQQTALAINPYHLGFTHLGAHRREARPRARARGAAATRTTSASSATTSTRSSPRSSGLFVYEARPGDEIKRRQPRHQRHPRGDPRAQVQLRRAARRGRRDASNDGSLTLAHDHASDGRGLDVTRAKRVLEYTHRVWRRPVKLATVNERGEPVELTA